MAWRMPVGIDQAGAQRHVAAALAMHRAGLRESAHALGKARRGGELAGMQFRIAAGQPGDVAGGIGRLVGQRREGDDLGARRAPAFQQMRIDKGERHVARQRDALARAGRRRGAIVFG